MTRVDLREARLTPTNGPLPSLLQDPIVVQDIRKHASLGVLKLVVGDVLGLAKISAVAQQTANSAPCSCRGQNHFTRARMELETL